MNLLQQHGRLQHLRARPIASERNGDSSLEHLDNTRHARSEIHIRHRAMDDDRPGLGDEIQLVVIEPYTVCELDIRAEHAKAVHPLDVAHAALFQTHVYFNLRLGTVIVRPAFPLSSGGNGLDHRLI